jgi:hypothetical protein
MNSNARHTYVLIAGAWHGGWVWRDVIPGLRELGHAVTAAVIDTGHHCMLSEPLKTIEVLANRA